jgi:hypothetical protein
MYEDVRTGARFVAFLLNKSYTEELLLNALRYFYFETMPPSRIVVVHGFSSELLSRYSELFQLGVVIPTDLGLQGVSDIIIQSLAAANRGLPR